MLKRTKSMILEISKNKTVHNYKYKGAGKEKPDVVPASSSEQRASKQVNLEYKSQCIEMVTVSGLLLIAHSAYDKFFCDIRDESVVCNILRLNETILLLK